MSQKRVTRKELQTRRDHLSLGIAQIDHLRAELAQQDTKLKNNRIATQGAISELDRLIAEIDGPAPAAESPKA
jgi:hypothetical protein